ncbi:MAG: hypothetical protein F8N36_12010 [Desulfovibrio sp.]|uniref:hypothetical protein n=1 Tax=Desulfovibrio sp. TaxID=885 RepID=UPI00135DAD9D|nr:hypothetical protein [Desulfovibrio sp.]MTJ93572.1 hypothetical protein [Desulfovibrio sp.]
MKARDIEVGVTFVGEIDWERGLGSHRTPFDIDDNRVLFRVEVGENPPACYVSHASMSLADFAAWARDRAPAKEPSAAPSI